MRQIWAPFLVRQSALFSNRHKGSSMCLLHWRFKYQMHLRGVGAITVVFGQDLYLRTLCSRILPRELFSTKSVTPPLHSGRKTHTKGPFTLN